MRRCLACGACFPSAQTQCGSCGAAPDRRSGFATYAPALALENDGFKPEFFAALAAAEEGHFWFRHRNRLIVWALTTYCAGFRSFLEVGCGTGHVLSAIARSFPHARLQGAEAFAAGLSFAAGRLPGVEFVQMDARRIPYSEEFDVIGAFDVIEHIREDGEVLEQLANALAPRGMLLLTVPQHPWLWSRTDDLSQHVRRYRASELHAKVAAAGFEIVRSTSFVSALLPVMAVQRLAGEHFSTSRGEPTAQLRVPRALNVLFESVLAAEGLLVRLGGNLPVGGSRLVVARKTA